MFYYIFGIVTIFLMGCFLIDYINHSAAKRLEKIIQAQKDGRAAVAKLTCLTREGKVSEPYYMAEYMYVAGGKRYFATYRITPPIATSISKEEYPNDILATEVKKYLTLFYEVDNPSKVLCKAEIFTSEDAFRMVTPNQKQNIYRDVEKDWTEAIDLTTYN